MNSSRLAVIGFGFAVMASAALAQQPAPDAPAPPPDAVQAPEPAPDAGPPPVQYGPMVKPGAAAPAIAAPAAAGQTAMESESTPKPHRHRNLPGAQADLRDCLSLKSNEQIIRCSEGRH